MKSVLIIIDSLGAGGAEKVLYTYLQHWNKEKFAITVVPVVDGGVYSSKIKDIKGIIFSPIISTANSLIQKIINKILYKFIYQYLSPKWVYRLFIPKNYDVEVAFCEGFVTKIISSSTNKKAKKITWIHTDLVNNDWPVNIGVFKNREEEILAYSKFESIIGVSQIVCNGFKKNFGLSNISCIYNPLDRNLISNSPHPLTKGKNGTTQLISIGRLVHDKGFDLLIKALSLLQKEKINFNLTILGEGSLRPDLEKLIDDKGLNNSVHLVGFKENPYDYLSAADIYISSSRYEGFSLAIAEAMITGLPVVSTNCAGPSELLENGKYGMLVECSVKGLTDGLREMILNKEIREKYTLKSQQRGKFFGIEEAKALSEKLFEE